MKRTDIKKILIIGSGPIVIGQAAEFDYAGTQACLALREEGYEVILVNSNPATIMTDTVIADKVYMEPLTLEYVCKIIRYERPDAIVPGIGGQTGLNLAMQLEKKGVLKECNVKLLGTGSDSIERAEDRERFKEMCQSIGEPVIPSEITYSPEEALKAAREIGYPVVLRPAFTLGGTGGGFANNEQELTDLAPNAFALSPVHQVLIEKSVRGYKEIEFEVMRDDTDRAITICGMEKALENGRQFFDFLGVSSLEEARKIDEVTLRDKACEWMGRYDFGTVFCEALDGKFCIGDSQDWFRSPDCMPVNVLMGHTSNEFFAVPPAQNDAELESFVKNAFGERADEVLSRFTRPATRENIEKEGKISAIGFAVRLADRYIRQERPLYYYYFNAPIPGWDDPGCFHSVDLWFFFETLAKCWRPFKGVHYDLARQMCDYWCNFIRTGDPNGTDSQGEALPVWPRFDGERPVRMEFDTACTARPCPPAPVEDKLLDVFVNNAKA